MPNQNKSQNYIESTKIDNKKQKKKKSTFWKDFRKFISRGNVLDMSVGVVIGGAFTAIVTAVTNVILSVCTWAIPGGLRGLITVLPWANETQRGLSQLGNNSQWFYASQLEDMIKKVSGDRSLITSNYTLHGPYYVYNGAAIIDWGSVINAAISFFLIAMFLFILIKIFTKLNKARTLARDKAIEAYYKKHPDERPTPSAPGIPEPTDHELLKEIRNALVEQNKQNSKKRKTNKK